MKKVGLFTNPVPAALSHLHCFGPKDIGEIIDWVTGVSREKAPPAAWPAEPPPLDDWLVGDCDHVREAFRRLLLPSASRRILLIKGEGRLGKSTLTEELAAAPSKSRGGPLTAARLDLKGGLNMDELLEPFSRKLRQRDAFTASAGRDAVARLAAIFDALEKDHQPAVLIFDTWETGGQYAQWVEQNALAVAAEDKWLRVVVAGRSVPETELAASAQWRDAAERLLLKKLAWADWRPLRDRLRPELPDDQLAALHEIVCGDHLTMRAALRVSATV